MCDVLDYHMEDGEKHFNLTSTLYYFLTKALLIFEKKIPHYICILNISNMFILQRKYQEKWVN